MKKIAFYIKIYFLLVSQYLKTLLQYRADFFISIVGLVLANLSSLVMFGVLFSSVKTINGWDFYDYLFVYSFSMLAITPQELFFNNVWSLRSYLREGSFIKYYLRPLNIMFYYMSELFDFKVFGRLIVGIVTFIIAITNLQMGWTFLKVILLLITLFSASMIMISIMLITSSLSFWFTDSNSVLVLATRFRDFSTYPLSIYNKLFRFIFTFVIPIGFIAFYPSQLFLSTGQSSILAYFSPIIGFALLYAAYKLWVKGANSWTGTGS